MEFVNKARSDYSPDEEEALNEIRRVCDSLILLAPDNVVKRIEYYKNGVLGDYSFRCIHDREEMYEYSSMDCLDHIMLLDAVITEMKQDVRSISA